MSTNHARDDWADPGTGSVLRRELDVLAGLGAQASQLDDALGTVRARVRRRRTAKQVALGASTFAVAGALVVGGATLLPEPPPDPVPAVTPTPSDDPVPTDPVPTASETSGADDRALFQDGHQPSWMEQTAIVCGLPVEDLPPSWGGGTLTTNGEPADGVLAEPGTADDPAYARVGVRLALGDDAPDGTQVNGVTLLWAQDGRLVDLGTNTLESILDPAAATVDLTAEDTVGWSCAPDGRVEGRTAYPHDLPAGAYEVRAFTRVWSADLEPLGLLLGEPFAVTVDPDGTVRAPALGGAGG
ncbi:hypothetical protein [Isoptericola dokdonensis]|uniref:Uncharacterized protein n=1 Tax=Isoptericola dokdonensis DS-3 TaxID=1300344 RepID=A0A161HYJ3_9MICO|nr:hypothetical protein [Isoptericola dokdonensis]ANC31513.1 hypothetical protein I598_1966 [Isoptericola dokdonensis DS-3]